MATGRKRQKVEGGFPDPWKPKKPGDVLEGHYLGADMVTAKGRTFRSYRIKPEGAEKPMAVAGAMLQTSLERVPIGSYVWITFKGEIVTDNGTAKDFEVETEEGIKLLDYAPDDQA